MRGMKESRKKLRDESGGKGCVYVKIRKQCMGGACVARRKVETL